MSAGLKAGDPKWLIKQAAFLDQSPNFDKLCLWNYHDRGGKMKNVHLRDKLPKKSRNLTDFRSVIHCPKVKQLLSLDVL